MNKTNDQDEETQTLFDDVDRIALLVQQGLDRYHPEPPPSLGELSLAVQSVMLAVQTLRPYASNSPTEYSPSPSSEKHPLTAKAIVDHLTETELELIQYMRSEGLSADKLTSVLSIAVQNPSLPWNVQHLKEET